MEHAPRPPPTPPPPPTKKKNATKNKRVQCPGVVCDLATPLRMSPALNESTALQRFERGNAVEICNGILFDFYPGLAHIVAMSG